MKRKYLSGSSKRKQKEIRLRNEEKGKRTLEQLNWGKTVSLDSPSELTTTEEEDVQIEESAEESNTLEDLTITNKPASDEITATSIAPTSRSDVGNSANATVTDVHSTSTSSDSSVQISNDVGRWKSLSESERDSVTLTGPQPLPKNLPKDSKGRSFPMSIFSRKMPNGETVARDWLVWSETAQSLFCFCCCLFATKSPPSARSEFSHPQLGCNDNWRKLYEKTEAHEKNVAHISNYIKWRDLILSLDMSKGIDSFQRQQFGKEKERWREILRSLLEVTLFLAERNLPFRGSTSAVGDPDNGLFLGSLELIGNHDSIINDHLDRVRKHQERGERMQAHYLSWQSQNEFINLCAKKVLKEILSKIDNSYYYGLMVDGTPDVSHTEQLTFVIRYPAQKNGTWEVLERFLKVQDCEKKKGEDICEVILSVLKEHNIDIGKCRGQGYDNGSNMSGCYKGVQALILEKNPQAIFAPCSAHTLNLCGVHAVEVATEIKSFFGDVQRLYNLFSSSPARWKILKETAGVSLHSLSDTRWSARIDAVRILVKNHTKMLEILSSVKTELDLTALAFSDAEHLLEWMKSFEYIQSTSVY